MGLNLGCHGEKLVVTIIQMYFYIRNGEGCVCPLKITVAKEL
jgi:hypothetical protein